MKWVDQDSLFAAGWTACLSDAEVSVGVSKMRGCARHGEGARYDVADS